MKYNIYSFIWETGEIIWRATGIDIYWPIKKIYPGFAPWLFGKMIGYEGKCINKGDSNA